MATFLEELRFKASLPWYKRILFPFLLSTDEFADYLELVGERTALDKARDRYLYHWNENEKKPSVYHKEEMEYWKDVIKYFEEKIGTDFEAQ